MHYSGHVLGLCLLRRGLAPATVVEDHCRSTRRQGEQCIIYLRHSISVSTCLRSAGASNRNFLPTTTVYLVDLYYILVFYCS